MDKFCSSLVYVSKREESLLFETEKKWYELKSALGSEPDKQVAPIKDVEQITALREYARRVYEQDIISYNDCKCI